jgi:type I restriction enzyme M protein
MPPEARWSYVLARASQPDIGLLLDDAMRAIEAANPQLKGVLFKNYAATHVAPHAYYELLNLVGSIGFGATYTRERDVLGRVYEYFIGRFAEEEGRGGGEFYTPRSAVKLLVEMLEPLEGRIFDPACGSGGMFVQSARFVEAHHGNPGAISVFGEESLEATWKICKMNLAIRGIAGNIQLGNSFHDDKFKDLRADFVMANPPFNISKWRGNLLQDDVRWRYGLPPDNNANYAWIQHFIYHLSPTGRAGFVMANGSMSVGNVEGEIRRRIVDDDLVDCMVALPGQLFYTTSIPVCLWFLAKSKSGKGQRDHRGETLFIDARKLFRKVDRTHNELTGEHVARIADTYHAWRGEPGLPAYQDIPGFCRSATLDEIRAHGFVLTPGRYVGAEEIEDDDEPFEEKMARLVETLEEQFAESARLEEQIRVNLKKLGYGC